MGGKKKDKGHPGHSPIAGRKALFICPDPALRSLADDLSRALTAEGCSVILHPCRSLTGLRSHDETAQAVLDATDFLADGLRLWSDAGPFNAVFAFGWRSATTANSLKMAMGAAFVFVAPLEGAHRREAVRSAAESYVAELVSWASSQADIVICRSAEEKRLLIEESRTASQKTEDWQEGSDRRRALGRLCRIIGKAAPAEQGQVEVVKLPRQKAPRQATIVVDMPWDASAHMGTGAYAESMVRALAAAAADADIVLAVDRMPNSPIDLPNVRYEAIPPRGGGEWRQIALPDFVRKVGADSLYCPATLCPVDKVCRTVITVHDLTFRKHPEYYAPGLVAYVEKWFDESLRAADHVVAVSEETKQDLVSICSVAQDMITVINPPVRESLLRPLNASEVERLLAGMGVERPFFFHVSNLAPHKNTAFAVRVLKEFLTIHPESRHALLFAGGANAPNQPPDFMVVAADMGIADRVRYMGRVSDEQLAALYRGCDAVLFPSLTEGWGLPVAEAAACGARVLATEMPAARATGAEVLALDPGVWADRLTQSPPDRPKWTQPNAGENLKRVLLDERAAAVRPGRARTSAAFSVVVPTFNDLPYLKLLLESIRRYSSREHEVVVVSDGATDGTREFLEGCKGITSRHFEKNRGICSATNEAAALATNDWLLFVNADNVLCPGWDEELTRILDDDTVVSGTCIEPGLVPVAPIFHTMDCGRDHSSFDWKAFESAVRSLRSEVLEEGVNYPFCISRSKWKEIGGLDTLFDPGPVSDPDLYYRFVLRGMRLVRSKSCLVYHFSGVSIRRQSPGRWNSAEAKNMESFRRKWGELPRYSMGGVPAPGPAAVSKVACHDHAAACRQGRSAVNPRISVQTIAREEDEFGAMLLRSCLESLEGYADQVVIVDNGLCDQAMDVVSSLRSRLAINLVDGRNLSDYSALRNLALDSTAEGVTHVHKIDTDEVYFPGALSDLKRLLGDSDVRSVSGTLVHFMIEPTLVESYQEKEVIFRHRPHLRWEGAAHESMKGLDPQKKARAEFSFLHFGYCRPQWQIFLKWLRYALLQGGGLSHYQYEFIDGVRVPWFRDGRTPDTVLEPRRGRLQSYGGPYAPSTKTWIEQFAHSGLSWREWVHQKASPQVWDAWCNLSRQRGCWEETLEEILTATSPAKGTKTVSG